MTVSNSNMNPSQRAALVAAIAPSQQAAGAQSTGWIDMRDWYTLLASISLGVLGAAATVDAKIEQAIDNAGTGIKDVPNLAITQLTKVGAADGKQAMINVRQDDLDRNAGYRFVRLTLTVGVAASFTAGAVVGLDPRYDAPANAASVAQVLS